MDCQKAGTTSAHRVRSDDGEIVRMGPDRHKSAPMSQPSRFQGFDPNRSSVWPIALALQDRLDLAGQCTYHRPTRRHGSKLRPDLGSDATKAKSFCFVLQESLI